MLRLALVLSVVVAALALAGPASSATVDCPSSGPCYGTSSADTIWLTCGTTIAYGYQGGDTIYGTSCSETIYAGDGGDTVLDFQAGDTVYGEGGADHLYGGDGGDRLEGGPGNDWLDGGPGADNLYGKTGQDSLHGAAGNDTLRDSFCDGGADFSSDFFAGESGTDTVWRDTANDLHDGTNETVLYCV